MNIYETSGLIAVNDSGTNDYSLTEKARMSAVSVDRFYVYGPTGIIAVQEGNATYFIIKDHLGSTRVVFNSSNQPNTWYNYTPYGTIWRSTQNKEVSYKVTGQERDNEIGLNNFRARMYDDTLNVFYAVDPGHNTSSPYGYVGGNPVSFIDPTGRMTYAMPEYLITADRIYDDDPSLFWTFIYLYSGGGGTGTGNGNTGENPSGNTTDVGRTGTFVMAEPPQVTVTPVNLSPMPLLGLLMYDLPAISTTVDPVQSSQYPFEDAMFESDNVIDNMWNAWVESGYGRQIVEVGFFVRYSSTTKSFETSSRIGNNSNNISMNITKAFPDRIRRQCCILIQFMLVMIQNHL